MKFIMLQIRILLSLHVKANRMNEVCRTCFQLEKLIKGAELRNTGLTTTLDHGW